MHPRPLFAAMAVLLASAACTAAPIDPTLAPTTSPVPTAPPEASEAPSPTEDPPSPTIWSCFGCPTDDVWVLDPDGPHLVALASPLGQFYDFSRVTGQFLGASHYADHGAGPGNVAVSDLMKVGPEGSSTVLVPDDVVVEALWMPSGADIVYVRALPDTYELRLLHDDGRDTLLASDVAFTFSPSPNGDLVAFTRESRYGLDEAPKGLFVIDTQGVEERLISSMDRAGSGGIDDLPAWSADQRYVFLTSLASETAGMVVASTDSSGDFELNFDGLLSEEEWYERPITAAIWYPEGSSLLGLTAVGDGHGMGSASILVRYELDLITGTIVAGEVLGQANAILSWERPGQSVWVLGGEDEGPRLLDLES